MIDSLYDLLEAEFRNALKRKPNWSREEIMGAFAASRTIVDRKLKVSGDRIPILRVMCDGKPPG